MCEYYREKVHVNHLWELRVNMCFTILLAKKEKNT